MQTRFSNLMFSGRARRAFSLIELLTAVSIMMVIIFALYAMFNQTQKALRANVTQVDVLESGRAAADIIGRELELLSACRLSQTINFYSGSNPVLPPTTLLGVEQSTARPPVRTNVLEEFFFLSRETNKWVGTGYRVIGARDGVGTLYRYTVSTNFFTLTHTNLMEQFMHAAPVDQRTGRVSTNFHRVADGVIHLRLVAYDPAGQRLGVETTNMHPSYRVLRLARSGTRVGLTSTANTANEANVILREDNWRGTQCAFTSNALPAYVEVELGVLEPVALKQYQALVDSPNLASAFLKKQAGKVHLFRQRIPIRTALQ